MAAESNSLAGMSVFVLEDESLVLFNMEDILSELECSVVGPAMRLEEADKLFEQACGADVAILDVNVGGRPVFPLAERLAARGLPLIFATGYGRGGLPETWQQTPVLQKPYTKKQVEQALQDIQAR
jgi:DNA-binding NarL/FixJ family response regulator